MHSQVLNLGISACHVCGTMDALFIESTTWGYCIYYDSLSVHYIVYSC